MKKWVGMLVCLTMLFGVTCVHAQTTYTAGTYTCEMPGRNGPIVATVTFDDNSIVDASVEHMETPYIGSVAVDRITNGLIEKQKIVDAVSGATQTSLILRLAFADCIDQAGGDSKALMVPDEPEPIKAAVEVCDVVVVGGGGSGINASIEMANRGLNVIMLEKEDLLGGTSITASTSLCGFGTPQHIAAGNTTTVDEYYADMTQISYVKKAFQEADPEIAYRLAQSFPTYAMQLMEWGADLAVASGFSLMPSDGSTIGSALFPALIDQLEPSGVDVRTGHKAVSILSENGAATGVVVECDAGSYEIHAKKVLMTFGGYLANNDIVAQYTPQYDGMKTTWSVGSTGEGLQMCMDLGAYLGGMDSIMINPACYPIPGANLISFTPIRTYGAIMVDIKTGERFANEMGDYTVTVSNMTDGKAYILFDQQVYDNCVTIQDYDKYGYFTKAETPEELAVALGLDPAALSGTVARYTGFVQNGKDEDFDRSPTTMRSDLSVGPYYATMVEPALHSPPGGIVTNARGQALREDGSIIENLYVSGHAADNTLVPSSLCGAVYYSRLVGELIAEELSAQ